MGPRPRLTQADCGDFRCGHWAARRGVYVVWSVADACWYYWCSPSACYFPYDPIAVYPPAADADPGRPNGAPPVVREGADRLAKPPVQEAIRPPAVPGPRRRRQEPAISAAISATPPPAGKADLPAGWSDYTSRDGAYTIYLPPRFAFRESAELVKSGDGSLSNNHVYMATLPNDASQFVVTYADLLRRAGVRDKLTNCAMARFVADGLEAGDKLIGDTKITLDGNPGGRNFWWTKADAAARQSDCSLSRIVSTRSWPEAGGLIRSRTRTSKPSWIPSRRRPGERNSTRTRTAGSRSG